MRGILRGILRGIPIRGRTALALAPVLGVVADLGVQAPAAGGEGSALADPAATYVTTIVVEDVDARGHVLATQTIVGEPQPIGTRQTFRGGPRPLLDSGIGGLPSPSGCRTLTVTNRTNTVTGQVAHKFITENHWCWNLKQQRVYDLTVHVRVADVDPFFRYRGVVNSFNDTITAGGRRVYRQGWFENCIPKAGCITSTYPSNDARLHSSGMWSWTTNG